MLSAFEDSALKGRRHHILTTDGYIGSCLPSVDYGDLVCVLLGCAMPMILRSVGGYYRLIGEVYLHGIMQGEAMKALNQGKKELQEFELH